jgi:hypothetical protein
MTTIAQFITNTQASFRKQRRDKGRKRGRRIAMIGAGLLGAGALAYGLKRIAKKPKPNSQKSLPASKKPIGYPTESSQGVVNEMQQPVKSPAKKPAKKLKVIKSKPKGDFVADKTAFKKKSSRKETVKTTGWQSFKPPSRNGGEWKPRSSKSRKG